MITSIITPSGANIHIPGKGMKSIPANSPVYDEVVGVLMDGLDLPEDQQLSDTEKIHRILRLIDREEIVRSAAGKEFEIIDGNIQIDGEFAPEIISKRILEFMNKKYDFAPLVKFWKHLRNNPDERARTDLFKFMEHNGIPVTDDGYFVAYKYVNPDYTSCRDSAYKNNPGNIVSKPRVECDSDPSVTCSHGLHVASWDYVKGYKTIVAVKVDPIDVVAVPYDYNGQKMRVCRYEVIEDIKGEYTAPRYDIKEEESISKDNFEYYGIKGVHKSLSNGKWAGKISHKNKLLDGVNYNGNNLTELKDNFVAIIDRIIKDTRFNYLRMQRDANGGFLKKKS